MQDSKVCQNRSQIECQKNMSEYMFQKMSDRMSEYTHMYIYIYLQYVLLEVCQKLFQNNVTGWGPREESYWNAESATSASNLEPSKFGFLSHPLSFTGCAGRCCQQGLSAKLIEKQPAIRKRSFLKIKSAIPK